MKICVWISEDAPPSQRAIARFLDGKRFLPAQITAATEDRARVLAQEFWDSEKAKYAKREGRKPATVADAIVERLGKADAVLDESDVPDLLLDCPDLVAEPDDIDDLLSPDG